ncbi:MAG TPA: ABC transporter permease, partial [Gemmatimonadales bacterium]
MKHRPTVRRLNSMHASQSRIARWRDALASDLRFAFRYFARHKATTAIIVTVLALGTGANALIFSTFQAWFLRPAPAMPNDGAQERIWAQQRDTRSGAWHPRGLSQPELERLAGRREVFQDVAAWMQEDVILGGDSVPVRAVSAQFVTSNYFAVLGVPLAAGAGFPSEDEAAPVAVLSYLAAQRLFGSARDAVGRDTRVNDVLVRVVGVAPPRFQGPLQNMNEPAVWMQLRSRAAVERVAPSWLTDEAALSAITRLAPGASRERATSIAREVVSGTLPDSAARVGMTRTADVLGMREPPPGPDRNEIIIAFTMILTVGILILLVAWTNVSSLMVAAAVGRRHEVAVRLSLGASRLRLVRQLVTESTLLALAGGIIGLTLAWQVLAWQMRTEIDGVNLAPDAVTFGFVLALAVATGILFGLSPALHATGGGVATALRDSGSGGASRRSRLQRGFV